MPNLSTLLKQLFLVNWPFWQSIMHTTLDFCPRPGRKQVYFCTTTLVKLREYCPNIHTVLLQKIWLFSFIWRASTIKYRILYNKSNLTFYHQNTGNLEIFYCRGTYIFIVRITFSKRADATIYTQYYLLSIPVMKNSCYHCLYPAIHCNEYDKITMINETR